MTMRYAATNMGERLFPDSQNINTFPATSFTFSTGSCVQVCSRCSLIDLMMERDWETKSYVESKSKDNVGIPELDAKDAGLRKAGRACTALMLRTATIRVMPEASRNA